jgi:two-component system phosphate regulon response regulator PhoB
MSNKLPPKALVVEADNVMRSSLCNAIERYWFNVLRAGDSETAFKVSVMNPPNVAIISTRIGREDAIKLYNDISSLEGCSSIPVIFICEEDEDLKSYQNALPGKDVASIVRPYIPSDIVIVIKNVLKKSEQTFQDKILKYKDLTIDLSTFKVVRDGRMIHLGPTEFKILQLLIQSPKTIFSRQQIVEYVWDSNQDVESRTVDVHVNRLRALIKSENDNLPFIKTVRAAGYCLNLPGEIDD